MGEACEHVLYDKGYGPTNLTLKHYLSSIFGEGFVSDGAEPREHEPTLVPLQDDMRGEPFDDGITTRALPARARDRARNDTAPGRARTPGDPESSPRGTEA